MQQICDRACVFTSPWPSTPAARVIGPAPRRETLTRIGACRARGVELRAARKRGASASSRPREGPTRASRASSAWGTWSGVRVINRLTTRTSVRRQRTQGFTDVRVALYHGRRSRKITSLNRKLNVDILRSAGVEDRLSCWRGIESCFFLNRWMLEWATLSGIAPAAPSQTHLLVLGAAEVTWKIS